MNFKQTALVLAMLIVGAAAAHAGVLNTGFLDSQANQDADLTMTEVPHNMLSVGDTLFLSWTPRVLGTLRYSTSFRGPDANDYPNRVQNPLVRSAGRLAVRCSDLPVGLFYCIVDGGEQGYSAVFRVIRMASVAPQMTYPITGRGRQGIGTVTPTFQWRPVQGVPYYHIIVSDQAFDITEDEDGAITVEGANLIWQAITSELELMYGYPDPSGSFDVENIPPLVGSMDRNNRPSYNWIVLNNYGNSVLYTSTVTGGISAFEVERQPPFGSPVLIAPEAGSIIMSDEVLLQWTQIPQANSYFVYVSREELTPGGSQGLIPAWNSQTTLTSITCPAVDVLGSGRFVWKVLAANRQGYGTISDTASFSVSLETGRVTFYTFSEGNDVLGNVELTVETIEGLFYRPFGTDDNGYHARDIPVGRYRFHANRAGFDEAVSDIITVENDQRRTVRLTLRPIPSSVVGTVVNEQNRAVSGAVVTALNRQTNARLTTETDVGGEYQLVVNPGAWVISATAVGHAPSREVSVEVSGGENYDFDDEHSALMVDLFEYTVSGAVQNPQGQPIHLADVIIEGPGGQRMVTHTPEGGSYSFLVGAGNWIMNARKPGFYLESGNLPIQIMNRNIVQNFTLIPQAGILSGQVYVDENLANRNVDLWFIPDAGQVTITRVNQLGAFSQGVSPGNYQVVPVRQGYAARDTLRIDVGPGETISGLVFRMRANPSSISGRITDAANRPISAATVSAGGVQIASAQDGTYRLGVAEGAHTVRATKQGYITAEVGPVAVQAGQNLVDVNLRLIDNAGTISGRVYRGNDAIFDAVITAIRQDNNQTFTVRSDQQGNYNFGLRYGTYRLTAQRSGFVAAAPGYIDVQLQAGQQVSGRNFAMLNNSARITGTVTSAAGPVNTPTIRMIPLDNPNTEYTTNGNVEGRFSLTVTPLHRYIIIATRDGFSTSRDTTRDTLAIEGEAVVNLRLLALPCRIQGTVTVNNQPLSGATVRADGANGSYQVTTGGAGSYQLNLESGRYDLTASKPGYTEAESVINLNPGQQRQGINFVLQENFALISGAALNPDRNPIAGATVELLEISNNRQTLLTSNQDGLFEFTRLVPGNYRLTARHPQYATGSLNIGETVGGQIRRMMNLVLQPLDAQITGIVRCNNNPLGGATVYAEYEDNELTTTTDENGLFIFPNVVAATYSLLPARIGYTGTVVGDQVVDPGDSVNVELVMIRNDGRITGFVRDPDGAGLRGARVSAFDNLGNFAAATTTPNGAYAVENLYPLSRYALAVQLANYMADQDTIRNVPVGEARNFTVHPNQLQVSGQVKNQAGRVLGNTEVHATSLADGSVLRAVAGANGNYTLNSLARGTRYRLQTFRLEEEYLNADRVLQTGENHMQGEDLVVIEFSSSISGTCSGVRQVTVEITNRTTGRITTAYTDAQGRFLAMRLREGDFVLKAKKNGYRVTPDSLVVAGLGVGEQRQNINFEARLITVTIAGQVLDSDGNAVEACPVLAWSAAGTVRDTTEQNGSFLFEGIYPNQTYRLATELPLESYENGTVDVPVQTSNVANVQLQIVRHNATLRGVITSAASGDSLQSAFIRLDNTQIDTSLRGGFYMLKYISGGDHNIQINKWGYVPYEGVVNTGNGEGEFEQNYALIPFDRAIFGQVFSEGRSERLEYCVVVLTDNEGDILRDTTDVNGRYYFDHLNPERTYSLRITKKGFQARQQNGIRVTDGSVEYTWELRLEPVSISGNFKLFTGQPIVGASVMLKSFENDVYWDTTDFGGDFTLRADNGRYMLLAVHPDPTAGTSFTRNVVLTGQTSVYLHLNLQNAAVIKGSLITDEGTTPSTIGYVTSRHEATGVIATDIAQNRQTFLLRGLRPGAQNLLVNASGYAMVQTPFIVEAAAGDTSEVTVVLTKSGKAISGFVFDDNGRGVARARVDITGPVTGHFVTAADGYFSLANPDTGRYTVHIERVGYVIPPDTVITVHAGEFVDVERRINLILNAISGRIQNDFAVQMADVMVVRSGVGNPDTVYSDHYGDYIFTDLEAGDHRVKAVKELYLAAPARRDLNLQTDQAVLNADFMLLLDRGLGDVSGTVTLENQRAVGIAITMTDLETYQQFRTETDDSGKFEFRRIPAPATYRIRAYKDGIVEIVDDPFRLLIDAEEIRDITFPTGKISARLTDANGNPIFNRAVRIVSDKLNWNQPFYTDRNGVAASFGFLLPGEYTITPAVGADELTPQPRVIALGENEQVVLRWSLGWALEPPPPVSFEDSLKLKIRIPLDVQVSENRYLYWKGPNEVEWERRQLQRDAGLWAEPESRGIRDVRSISHPLDRDEPGGLYYAYIPPQHRGGVLQYYFEVHTIDGLVFGGPSTVQEIQISNAGMLDHLEFTRTMSSANPRLGVPITLTVRAFDDQDIDLSSEFDQNTIQWSQLETNRGDLVVRPNDPTLAEYHPHSIGPVKIRVQVSQAAADVILRNDLEWINEDRVLASIKIVAPKTTLASGDSMVFTIDAKDTGDVAMPILPVWIAENPEIGVLESVPFTQSVKIKTMPGMIGMAQIAVTDSLTGLTAYFNAESRDPSKRGLSVYGVVNRVSGQNDTLTFRDGQGFEVSIPRSGVDVGAAGSVFLWKPQLASVVRVTPEFECPQIGYRIDVGGNLGDSVYCIITLPTPDEFTGLPPLLGSWDENNVVWILREGVYNADSSQVTASFDKLRSLFSFIVSSQPLSLEDLKFNPNPFSPENSLGGVSIEFVLNSDIADRLPVSLKIYNMAGELIRTLFDAEMLEKGKYYRNAQNLDKIIIWNGLTDFGRMARNGRYIAVLTAKDPSGEVKKVGTLVLIK